MIADTNNPAAKAATAPRPGERFGDGGVSLLAVSTLALWSSCFCIGAAGLVLSYGRPVPPPPPPPPLEAELLSVELTDDPLPAFTEASSSSWAPEPPSAEPLAAPDLPPLVAVAEPGSAVEFAVPVEGPVRLVDPREAAPMPKAMPNPQMAQAAPAPAQTLTYGQGEGRQPAPEYPRQAVREGQEGTVRVRFTVGESGRVLAAEAIDPCPWPLLNEAALRAIRERWRFRSGAPRAYEVSIRFALAR